MGNYEEVISKIMVLEEQAEDRYARMNYELAVLVLLGCG